jgi:hypothetical protein
LAGEDYAFKRVTLKPLNALPAAEWVLPIGQIFGPALMDGPEYMVRVSGCRFVKGAMDRKQAQRRGLVSARSSA